MDIDREKIIEIIHELAKLIDCHAMVHPNTCIDIGRYFGDDDEEEPT